MECGCVFSESPMLQWNLMFNSQERIAVRWLTPQDRWQPYVDRVNKAFEAGEPCAVLLGNLPYHESIMRLGDHFGRAFTAIYRLWFRLRAALQSTASIRPGAFQIGRGRFLIQSESGTTRVFSRTSPRQFGHRAGTSSRYSVRVGSQPVTRSSRTSNGISECSRSHASQNAMKVCAFLNTSAVIKAISCSGIASNESVTARSTNLLRPDRPVGS